MTAFVRIRVLGRKAPDVERFSPVAVPSPPTMLECLTPPLRARGAEPGDSGDKALAGGARSTVGTHAGLQRGAHRAGLVSVRCRWVKYPEGVETDTSMGKPGHAESLTGFPGLPADQRPALGWHVDGP